MLLLLLLACADDMSLAYHSLLPMDVRGPLGGQLKLVTKHDSTPVHTVSTQSLPLSVTMQWDVFTAINFSTLLTGNTVLSHELCFAKATLCLVSCYFLHFGK